LATVISSSSNGLGGGGAAGAADAATPARRRNEGRAAAATPVTIPEFKNPRRLTLEIVLDSFVCFKVLHLLTEFQNSNGKVQMANVSGSGVIWNRIPINTHVIPAKAGIHSANLRKFAV
jgi:hypothetical protein